MLGHASAAMTLDTYGHLFEDRLDEVSAAMEAARDSERQQTINSAHEGPIASITEIPASFSRPNGVESPNDENPLIRISAGREAFSMSTPDRIRTGATALRGRRARPLHNGGLATCGTLLGSSSDEPIADP
jgi:hypothetical protein